ncbi:MAG: hypothetical protein J6L70_02550 [Alphaproteobacteria bacterium]|nr:hypothetical protein [Alphaproteobacteria bacterium]
MKRLLCIIMAYIVGVGIADAAVRDANTVARTTQSQTIVPRNKTSVRSNTINRPSVARTSVSRIQTSPTNGRTNNPNVRTSSTERTARSATTARTTNPTNKTPSRARAATNMARPARAATQSQTFGTGYNACRDAYFTCMDQFCATQNDTYRRCVCSSRLSTIKSRESLLSQTANSLQDFQDLNMTVIDKSASEVKAMISASAGELIASSANDTSASAQQLSNISKILSRTKSQSLSTSGTLDIGGNINQIWQTTDLADGANIANLTGESLYNAVHAQCSQMVADACESKSTLNMVVSAYGMYIENDCTTLSNALDSKTNAAKGSVRETEYAMHDARLENYNTHNSTSINDCVANVRSDLTANTACGPDYIHCLDVSGRYLSRDTGEPIYSPEFYQLNEQLSVSGDILNNQTNRLVVAELNRMRPFAAQSLDTCRDIADAVWDEFMRGAITEIYQGQQKRIRQVKTECLDVVNKCYDEQTKSLKDFSNIKDQLLLGQRLELSEQMCQEKLLACSNLYGNGTNGMDELLNAMHNVTDAKIAKECRATLMEYAQNICAVPTNDTLHAYPYACRVYAPGQQKHARSYQCNQQLWSDNNINTPTTDDDTTDTPPVEDEPITPEPTPDSSGYACSSIKKYISCSPNYYMTYNGDHDPEPRAGNECTECPDGYTCAGGTEDAVKIEEPDPEPEIPITPEEPESDISDVEKYGHECEDYPGSMYQRLVRYALQTCVRPSDANNPEYTISVDVLSDVNAVMDSIRADMGTALSKECERLGGTWVDTVWVDKENNKTGVKEPDNKHDTTSDDKYKKFYDETGASTQWGYCTLISGNTTTEEKQETLSEICKRQGGEWRSIAWVDTVKNRTCCAAGVCATGDGEPGADGCHDYNGDILLSAFYNETMAETTYGYCKDSSH